MLNNEDSAGKKAFLKMRKDLSETPQESVKTLLEAIADATRKKAIDDTQKVELLPIVGTLKGIAEGKITTGTDSIKEQLIDLSHSLDKEIKSAANNAVEHGISINGNPLSRSLRKRTQNKDLDTPQKSAKVLLDLIQQRSEGDKEKDGDFLFAKTTKEPELNYSLNILKGIAAGKITAGTPDITNALNIIAKWSPTDDKMHEAISDVFKHGTAVDGKDLSDIRNAYSRSSSNTAR